MERSADAVPVPEPRGQWLITGGCGFVGSAVAARLVRAGCRVRVVDDISVGRPEALPEQGRLRRVAPDACGAVWQDVELVVADIRDAAAAQAAARGADVIVHLAARTGVIPSIEDPFGDCAVNVLGTLNFLDAARRAGTGRFVMASSSAPLGAAQPPFHEGLAPHPLSPYGASKLAGEGYCAAFHGSYGLDAVALRISNVYGPGSSHKGSVVAKFCRDILSEGRVTVYGDGEQTRDFIYVADVVEAIVRAATAPGIGGEIFHIASGHSTTVNEVARMIGRLIEARTGRRIEIGHHPPRAGELVRFGVDTGKAHRRLGFATATGLEEGLAATVEYFLVR